jgi:hypothetical protein
MIEFIGRKVIVLRINIDCIRDLLIFIEEEQTMEELDLSLLGETGKTASGRVQPINSAYLLSHEKLKHYSPQDILYSIKQMGEGGLLDVDDNTVLAGHTVYEILDITPYGHEFISNLKDGSIWKKVKTAIKTVSGASIPVISKVAAETVIKQLLP